MYCLQQLLPRYQLRSFLCFEQRMPRADEWCGCCKHWCFPQDFADQIAWLHEPQSATTAWMEEREICRPRRVGTMLPTRWRSKSQVVVPARANHRLHFTQNASVNNTLLHIHRPATKSANATSTASPCVGCCGSHSCT
jgi:hypothetical protein